MEGGNSSKVDPVEVGYRGSKGSQGWKGTELVKLMGNGENMSEAAELLQML